VYRTDSPEPADDLDDLKPFRPKDDLKGGLPWNSRFLRLQLCLVCYCCHLLNAQVTMRGNIPFNFQVGETALPAGEYVIQQAGTSRMLTMRNLDRETGAIMYVVPQSLQAESARNTRLVFHRYGGTYFLSQVWQGRGQNGDALPQSKAERVTARQGTALPIPPTTWSLRQLRLTLLHAR
jgi:hypothetical protein